MAHNNGRYVSRSQKSTDPPTPLVVAAGASAYVNAGLHDGRGLGADSVLEPHLVQLSTSCPNVIVSDTFDKDDVLHPGCFLVENRSDEEQTFHWLAATIHSIAGAPVEEIPNAVDVGVSGVPCSDYVA